MAKSLADAIVKILHSSFGDSKKNRRVAILLSGHPVVAAAVSAAGYQTLVISDRFRLLYRIHRKIQRQNLHRPLIVESAFDGLPIREKSLDAIVLLRNIYRENGKEETLKKMRNSLKADGVIIWPQSAPGKLRRISRVKGGLPERAELTAMAMEAGFGEIGQIVVSSQVVTWIITVGKNKPQVY